MRGMTIAATASLLKCIAPRRDGAEPAVSPLIVLNGKQEFVFVKIRPERVGKIEFRIGGLP